MVCFLEFLRLQDSVSNNFSLSRARSEVGAKVYLGRPEYTPNMCTDGVCRVCLWGRRTRRLADGRGGREAARV